MLDEAHEWTDGQIAELARKLERLYLACGRRLTKRMRKALADFARLDAEKATLVESGQLSESEWRTWRSQAALMDPGVSQALQEASAALVEADKLSAAMIDAAAVPVYAENRNWQAFSFERDSGLATRWDLVDANAMKATEGNLLPSVKVDDAKDWAWNSAHVSAAVRSALLTGQDVRSVARSLGSVAAMDYRSALTQARTAVTAAENMGRLDELKLIQQLAGIEVKKQWMATLDGRTRHSHRHCDGESKRLDEEFSCGCRFPGDPEGPAGEVYNCRCTLVVDLGLDDVMSDPSRRASKLGSMSYEGWKNGVSNPSKARRGRPVVTPAARQACPRGYSVSAEVYRFGDGTEGGVRATMPATIYTSPEGTRFVFQQNMDPDHQKLSPQQLADAYAKVPEWLRRKGQSEIVVQDVENPQDDYWRQRYTAFSGSYATGGGTIDFWRFDHAHDDDYLLEVLCHEMGHHLDQPNGRGSISEGLLWTGAMDSDLELSGLSSVTEYGKNSPAEDFAESVAEFVKNEEHLRLWWPARWSIVKMLSGT